MALFCALHEINRSEVAAACSRAKERVDDLIVHFDTEAYGDLGVLRIEFSTAHGRMLPMLFGTDANLSSLSLALWTTAADTWHEEMDDLTHSGTYLKRRVLLPAILEQVDGAISDGAEIIEVGCGDGVLLKELVARYPAVWGMDFVPRFIEQLVADLPHLRERLFVADIVRDAPRRSFDIVVASAVLLNLPEIERGLENLVSYVRPGGRLVIADVCSRTHRSLGYQKGPETVIVHDSTRVHHFEKDVGGGHTVSVHCYHYPGLYRSHLEHLGLECVYGADVLASRDAILADEQVGPDAREKLLEAMQPDLTNPTFFVLAARRRRESAFSSS